MNRLTDFWVGFGFALLLHGVLVLGMVWFWTLRPPELRPLFQGGDFSLAVTFVEEEEEGGQPARRSLGESETTDPPSPERFPLREAASPYAQRASEDTSAGQVGGQAAGIGSRNPEISDRLTDPEEEIADEASVVASSQLVVVSDSSAEPPIEEGEDPDMLDAETAAPVSALASANAPAAGSQNANQGSESSDAPGGTLRQGVSGAVRMQSEIRPYYPLGARLRGEEGAVTVRVWVNPSGRARRCKVARSSGYPALDEAAVDAARRARYVSTRPGAWQAEVETTLTFRFRLTE